MVQYIGGILVPKVAVILVLLGCETDFPPLYHDVLDNGVLATEVADGEFPHFSETFTNADTIIRLKNYLGNYQNTHPKVLYFPQKLYGHKYWMAYTPYPKGKPKYENPSIAFSDNGKTWYNIVSNPIDNPQGKSWQYNSDTHLVYNSTTERLEAWFRYADEHEQSEIIYRMTSTNGYVWQTKEVMHTSYGAHCARCLSPAILHDGDKYQIWLVNAEKKAIDYYESTTGADWQYIQSINLPYDTSDVSGYTPWHIDVIWADGKYRMVVMAKHPAKNIPWTLFYTESVDNQSWLTPYELLHPRKGHWDEQLYRSSIVQIDGGYALYYAAKRQFQFLIGVTWAKSFAPAPPMNHRV